MNSESSNVYSAAANEQIPCITIGDSGESEEETEDLFLEFFGVPSTAFNSAPKPALQHDAEMSPNPVVEPAGIVQNHHLQQNPLNQREMVYAYQPQPQQHQNTLELVHYDPNQQGILQPVPEGDSNCELVYDDSYGYVDGMPQGSDHHSAGCEAMTAGGPIRKPRARNPPTSHPFSARRKARAKNYKTLPKESSLLLPLLNEDGTTVLKENVSERISYELSRRGIAQGFFAEKVLGIKQSAFSETIIRPKERMRAKGLLKYQKLITWLNLNEEDKYKVLNGDLVICSSDEEQKPVAEPEKDNETVEDVPKEKKKNPRTQFSPDQLNALQTNFKANPYPNKEEKQRMSFELALPFRAIDNWFVNTRRRNPVVAPVQPAESNSDE